MSCVVEEERKEGEGKGGKEVHCSSARGSQCGGLEVACPTRCEVCLLEVEEMESFVQWLTR